MSFGDYGMVHNVRSHRSRIIGASCTVLALLKYHMRSPGLGCIRGRQAIEVDDLIANSAEFNMEIPYAALQL